MRLERLYVYTVGPQLHPIHDAPTEEELPLTEDEGEDWDFDYF